jgi:catechol 2,3-dioxygenase-like lactoylglutathione lyase family enzyme
MTAIKSVALEVPDVSAARAFYADAFGFDGQIGLRDGVAASTGFRGFTLSLIVSQPANADALFDTARAAGASELKRLAKTMWGYGGVVQTPDGTIWKLATSSKKNNAPASREFDEIALLLGVASVSATKKFYAGRGLKVAKSFGPKYVEFESTPGAPVKLALYRRAALAKDAGVAADGSGSHRLVIGSDAGAFTDPDGFLWEEDECKFGHPDPLGGYLMCTFRADQDSAPGHRRQPTGDLDTGLPHSLQRCLSGRPETLLEQFDTSPRRPEQNQQPVPLDAVGSSGREQTHPGD